MIEQRSTRRERCGSSGSRYPGADEAPSVEVGGDVVVRLGSVEAQVSEEEPPEPPLGWPSLSVVPSTVTSAGIGGRTDRRLISVDGVTADVNSLLDATDAPADVTDRASTVDWIGNRPYQRRAEIAIDGRSR